MRVGVTGATGMVGRVFVAALRARGDAVTVFSRDPLRAQATLGDVEALPNAALESATLSRLDAVVNLAGEPVAASRWTDARKRVIVGSRVDMTRAVVDALATASPRPAVLVNASAVGYYGACGDAEVTEERAPGDDFLASVCIAWEREARRAEALDVRVVYARIGVVLGERGGALARMIPAFKMFVGGPVGDGRQYLPWVHVDDVVGLLLHALDHPELRGSMNVTAPSPARFADFARALGEALGRPSWMPVPSVALRVVMGELADAILTGQRALPRVALATGYTFHYPELPAALRAALRVAREG